MSEEKLEAGDCVRMRMPAAAGHPEYWSMSIGVIVKAWLLYDKDHVYDLVFDRRQSDRFKVGVSRTRLLYVGKLTMEEGLVHDRQRVRELFNKKYKEDNPCTSSVVS